VLRKPSALIATFGIAGAVLAGCGGSGSVNQPAGTRVSHARQTPLMANADIGAARQQSTHHTAALGQLPPGRSHSRARADSSRLTAAKVTKARQTPESSKDDESETGAKPLNPCKLVSLAEAQAIAGRAITKVAEAPLGPTCIYNITGRAAAITLAVETESFSQATRYLSERKHVVIKGRRSLCGRLGTQTLFVPLTRYQLLNVTAPCGIAERLAGVAVSRLSA
jgi:hypothetical protein